MDLNERKAWFNRRERQILVHSFLYYQMDMNIITDHLFDLWSKELAEDMQEFPEAFALSEFYKDFIPFDGSSGAFLPYANPDIQQRGLHLIRIHKSMYG